MYKIIKFIQDLLLKAPLPACFFIGRVLGILFYLDPRKRKAAFKNIKSAFPGESNQKLARILRRSFSGFGLSIVEGLISVRLLGKVEISGSENVTAEGGIFLGVHSGSWELINMAFGAKYKYAIFARQQKVKSLGSFLKDLREEGRMKVCFSLRELIKCLKEGYFLGMVADQGAESDALDVEFFSQLVPTPKGAVYLAGKFDKNIYPCFSYRESGFSHTAIIGEPIKLESRTTYEVLRELNKFYEEYVSKYPWEYYWPFKRFKRKRNREVLILSDGKPGHLKQSESLLGFLRQENYKISSRIVEVRYRGKFTRILADGLAALSFKNLVDFSWALPFLLTPESAKALEAAYGDIIISTGSFSAPVNVLTSSLLSAKSAVILRPNIPLTRFDLAFIPEHDRLCADNAVGIKGALYFPGDLEDKIKRCSEAFSLGSQKKISFFVGGPLAGRDEFMNNLKSFLFKLKEFSAGAEYKLLVSTSRRTPDEAVSYVEAELKGFKPVEAVVIAGRKNYDFVFDAFCGLAGIVFVSSESISMISEIASLKKACVCVELEPMDDKRKVFFDSLKGEVNLLAQPYVIEAEKYRASEVFDKNSKSVAQAIKKLL